MKHLIHIILIFSFIISILACSKSELGDAVDETSKGTAKRKKICLACGYKEMGDNNFNAMQYNGLIEASRLFSIDVSYRLPRSNTEEALLEILEELTLEESCDMIITSGFLVDKPLQKVAREHPKTHYAILDNNISNLANVTSVNYAQHEGSFVVGVLAALLTKTGKIGFIGGVDIPVIKEFLAGFTQGIAYAKTSAKLRVEYCSLLPDYSGFGNPEKGLSIADKMYAEGVDIIFGVAGGTNNGIISSAEKHKRYVIGVDSNQDHMAKGYVLTSMMKRLDNSVIDLSKKFLAGSLQGNNLLVYSYRNKGISITDMQYTREKIPPSTLTKIEEIEKMISNGTIVVEKEL